MKTIKVVEEFTIPGTDIVLEEGDTFKVKMKEANRKEKVMIQFPFILGGGDYHKFEDVADVLQDITGRTIQFVEIEELPSDYVDDGHFYHAEFFVV